MSSRDAGPRNETGKEPPGCDNRQARARTRTLSVPCCDVAGRACDDLLVASSPPTTLPWPSPAQGKRHVPQVGAWSGSVD
jgi:hypothetical protein